jgi:hypothetical protein
MHELDPEGIPFQIEQDQQLKLVTEGEWKGWIVEKHPDGHSVAKWEATTTDLERIATFCKCKWMSKDMGSSHAGGIWHEREKKVREMMEVPTRRA